jgi:hypothetical protein
MTKHLLAIIPALVLLGCGSGSGGGGSSIGFMPQSTNYWAVVVDVTPSVELSNEADAKGNPDAGSEPGEFVGHELELAKGLRADGFKTDYFLITGTIKPETHVDRLPASTAEIGDQNKPISDYAACLTEIIDRYHDLKKDQKVRLTIMGDFRHASGSQNYRNWAPTPAAFGGRRIDGWEVDLVYPNYPSGSDSGAQKRTDQWKECLTQMGASSVNTGTQPAF